MCDSRSRVLLIDLHSYHDVIVPADFLQPGRKTPDLCIGTDSRFTSPVLLDLVRTRFEEAGLCTEVNYPYSGFYIPGTVEDGTCSCEFQGFMLEFHRRSYLDEEGKVIPEKRDRIREAIRRIIKDSGETDGLPDST